MSKKWDAVSGVIDIYRENKKITQYNKVLSVRIGRLLKKLKKYEDHFKQIVILPKGRGGLE